MRAAVQRVSRAEVRVEGRVVGRIGRGLLILVGVSTADTAETGKKVAEKVVNLRIFDNDQEQMDHSLLESGGDILCVSEFTLYGDCRRGRRPSYAGAAPAEAARPLYEAFVESLRELIEPRGGKVETGQFRAMMEVDSVNDGPVTLLIDSDKVF